MSQETVLVVGATGNVGVAAVRGALAAGKKVLAIVRNSDSAAKLFKHVGTKEDITTVEADVLTPAGVQGVVDQARAGKLPAFQHVYATVGGAGFFASPIHEQTLDHMQRGMKSLYEANLYAYLATIPYLLEQAPADTSFTVCIGGAVDAGFGGVTAITQGALLGLVNAAMAEHQKTNVRVIEAWLCAFVAYDENAGGPMNAMPASEYAKVYTRILTDKKLKGVRSSVYSAEDTQKLRFEPKSSAGAEAAKYGS